MSAKEAVIEAIRAMPEGLTEPEIVAKLTTKYDMESSDEEVAEINRRVELIRSGQAKMISHDEFMTRLREKFV